MFDQPVRSVAHNAHHATVRVEHENSIGFPPDKIWDVKLGGKRLRTLPRSATLACPRWSTTTGSSRNRFAARSITSHPKWWTRKDTRTKLTWAIGCILYTLLVGNPPFETETLEDTYNRIKANQYTIPPKIGKDAAALITHLLEPDPAKRPRVTEILNSQFFTDGHSGDSIHHQMKHNELSTEVITQNVLISTVMRLEKISGGETLENIVNKTNVSQNGRAKQHLLPTRTVIGFSNLADIEMLSDPREGFVFSVPDFLHVEVDFTVKRTYYVLITNERRFAQRIGETEFVRWRWERPTTAGNIVTEPMIDDFCKIVYKAMLVTPDDDIRIDTYRRVLDLVFNSFNAFLHSEHMKKYIKIDSTGNVLSQGVREFCCASLGVREGAGRRENSAQNGA
ncbi:hypothetical protein niasHS_012707 [Heterodera schachtii]|uniref:Protein kinase domain-containing protein n=1 Tax=Heterodera schachtii TaxID=97005 RepID=A0ABD2ILL9_HETSC